MSHDAGSLATLEVGVRRGVGRFCIRVAAMTAAILSTTPWTKRRHVVAVRPLYGGTDYLVGSGLLGVEVTFCEEHQVADTVRRDTALVILETPANPTLDRSTSRQ